MARPKKKSQSNKKLVVFEGITVKMTPMLEQFIAAKNACPDAVLFFRMGDFYETFFDDAKLVHRELGLTLTARTKGNDQEDPIPMAGVPFRAATDYIVGLVEKGYRVAVCDQLEDPTQAAGIVRRGITRIVTPGTLEEPESEGVTKDARLLGALACRPQKAGGIGDDFGLAWVDVATGTFKVTELLGMAAVTAELKRLGIRELLVSQDHQPYLEPALARQPRTCVQPIDAEHFESERVMRAVDRRNREELGVFAEQGDYLPVDRLRAFFSVVEAARFRTNEVAEAAVSAVLWYISEVQRGVASHMAAIEPYRVDDFMVIDEATQANLELTETMRGGRREGSVLGELDETVTAAGSRYLKTWLTYPLLDKDRVETRLDAIEVLLKGFDTREKLRELLDSTHDIERLCGRLATGRATPRQVVQLRHTLERIPALHEVLEQVDSQLLQQLVTELDPCDDVRQLIADALVDEPPLTIADGGVVREGYDTEFDRIVTIARSGRDWLLKFEQEQKEATGISSLKIKYSRVFGYFIEVTRANLHLVPEHYIRKQTLANSERYYTPELKEYEEEVLSAEDRRLTLEIEIFETIRAAAAEKVGRLRQTAAALAQLDVLSTLAAIAHSRGYCRPVIREDDVLVIEEGRHPVVERFMKEGERFVPNDLEMNGTDARLQIITGPNMAGKSTVIRQAALITLLAQSGSFVPAARAEIGLVDRIFSRVGASDNLALGQSTFMVEMTEAAHILNHATQRSLIILDEIGRGTATYDGLSIAWAVAEYLHDEISARVLFATHYHELTELARTLEGVVNYSVAVKEWQQEIIFLRKLVPGSANRSYGIQVARLAGLPGQVIERAGEILHNLEMNAYDEHGQPTLASHEDDEGGEGSGKAGIAQFDLFGRRIQGLLEATQEPVTTTDDSGKNDRIVDEIERLSLDTTTPLQALNLLFKLQRRIKGR